MPGLRSGLFSLDCHHAKSASAACGDAIPRILGDDARFKYQGAIRGDRERSGSADGGSAAEGIASKIGRADILQEQIFART